jgi:FMN phosphatase YigB (HAD superfamily)
MPLTLEQYATWLDARDLPWPAPPDLDRPRARPSLTPLPEVRAVLWNVYGTLLHLAGGELWFEHPTPFVMTMALDKTIQEFKMWGSMSRKPGQPSAYMSEIYAQVLAEQRSFPAGGERFPEVAADRIWEAILKRLLKKDYKFDAGFYGSLNEFSRKVAYFFHASLQATACQPGAAETLRHCARSGLIQGLLAEGQCFTLLQLQRGLAAQDPDLHLDQLIPSHRITLSAELRARKPSERLFRAALEPLRQEGLEMKEILHVGSRITQDVLPARRLGLRTALFAGDKASLQATAEQLKDPQSRPDVLLTELTQLTQVLGTISG